MKTKWRKCDHPRTAENTRPATGGRGGRCRACFEAGRRKWNEVHREAENARKAQYLSTPRGHLSRTLSQIRYEAAHRRAQ